MVAGTPQRDQVAVDVIQEEEPLQLRAGRFVGELPVRFACSAVRNSTGTAGP
jgi:hypothetical protein